MTQTFEIKYSNEVIYQRKSEGEGEGETEEEGRSERGKGERERESREGKREVLDKLCKKLSQVIAKCCEREG